MGRVLMRVPMDFDLPINEIWPGYLSPDWRPCPSDNCEIGYRATAYWVNSIAHLLLMLSNPITREHPLHPWLNEIPCRPKALPNHEDAKAFTEGLAGRESFPPFGHDALDRSAAARAIIKAAGLPDDWSTCPICNGHAIHPDDLEASEAWEPTEPPTGEGYQLWTTTNEGAPISPVFATMEELCEYAAANCTVFASDRASALRWREMLDDDFVYSEMQAPDGSKHIFL